MSGHPSRTSTARLEKICRAQIDRAPWPDFEAFDASAYPLPLRERAARQWWRRAREEYGSIHEFTQVAHALTTLRAPIGVLGALARLIGDEVRHASLCAQMAEAMLPERAPGEVYDWTPPRAPWPAPPSDAAHTLRWAADAVLCSCCIGETISRPLFEALATLVTDPVPQAVVRQILRDEHLHATFGWEALGWMLGELGEGDRAWLQGRLAKRLGAFERSCVVGGVTLADLAGEEAVVAPPGPDAPPNLGHLDARLYAMIFYSTLESEVLPRFAALGFDTDRAWRERGLTREPDAPST
ncbi:MAG: hypothetical protein EVA89_39090 [Sandaracinaceae bacterium]|nr:MAG: hypothetical protein EVA89_39090 [Sandaracinaceae bacterium]